MTESTTTTTTTTRLFFSSFFLFSNNQQFYLLLIHENHFCVHNNKNSKLSLVSSQILTLFFLHFLFITFDFISTSFIKLRDVVLNSKPFKQELSFCTSLLYFVLTCARQPFGATYLTKLKWKTLETIWIQPSPIKFTILFSAIIPASWINYLTACIIDSCWFFTCRFL